jgi:hypothetical protein
MFTLLQFLIILAVVALAFSFSSQGEDTVMTVLLVGNCSGGGEQRAFFES